MPTAYFASYDTYDENFRLRLINRETVIAEQVSIVFKKSIYLPIYFAVPPVLQLPDIGRLETSNIRVAQDFEVMCSTTTQADQLRPQVGSE